MKTPIIFAVVLMLAVTAFAQKQDSIQKVNQDRLYRIRCLRITGRTQILTGIMLQAVVGGIAYATGTYYNTKHDIPTQNKRKAPVYIVAAIAGLIGINFEFNGIDNIHKSKVLFIGNGIALKF
jgi:hypothetical protein